MPRSHQTQKKSAKEKGKSKKVIPEPKGVETSKVTKKRAPPKGVRRTPEKIRKMRKRIIMDAQEKPATIPKMTILRIVKSCCRNWSNGDMKIQKTAIEMIRQHCEFVVNKALRDSNKLMMESSKRVKKETGETVYGVMVCNRHTNHVLTTDKFYTKATTIPFAIY
jgi:histone H3/H4